MLFPTEESAPEMLGKFNEPLEFLYEIDVINFVVKNVVVEFV